MAGLQTELIAANGKHSVNITKVAGWAVDVQHSYGIHGWVHLATIGLEAPRIEAEESPLVLLSSGWLGAFRLPMALFEAEQWSTREDLIRSYTVAVAGSQYLHALAGLKECSSKEEFAEREQELPAGAPEYLRVGEVGFYACNAVGVRYEAYELVVVSALNDALLNVEYAG